MGPNESLFREMTNHMTYSSTSVDQFLDDMVATAILVDDLILAPMCCEIRWSPKRRFQQALVSDKLSHVHDACMITNHRWATRVQLRTLVSISQYVYDVCTDG